MTMVSRNCSPWRSITRSSIPAWAATIRHIGAAPGFGVNSPGSEARVGVSEAVGAAVP